MLVREVMANQCYKGLEDKRAINENGNGCIEELSERVIPCDGNCRECYDMDMKETRK